MKSLDSLKVEFKLDPNFIYLNHGSFGACPNPIFEERSKWQEELEKHPVSFIEDRVVELIDWSRDKLSDYIHCHKDDLVYFPNPTTAMNMVIRSLNLSHGDEVLTSNHEYGAMDRTWKFMSKKKGFHYSQVNINLPMQVDEFISSFISRINKNTKVLFLSHITSSTGIRFPIEELCKMAKEKGIITIIDGAHVPGHIPLNLNKLNVDIYTGACHKWMLCPKGTSFLFASKEIQNTLEPLVVSWGWESEYPSHSQFLDFHQYQGTNDPSSYLTVPRAIEFLDSNNWSEIQDHCHKMTIKSREILLETVKTKKICSDSSLGQMASIQINIDNRNNLDKFLKEQKIVIPIIQWEEFILLRVSFQCYNTMEEIEFLNKNLRKYLNGI